MNDVIFEMANIGPRLHGFGVDIKMNLLQPGDKKLKHGPRAKFFKNTPDDSFSISIDQNPAKIMLIGDYSELVKQGEADKLVEKVKKYRIPLLNFWHQPGMTVDELRDQMELVDRGQSVKMVFESSSVDYHEAIENAETVDDIEKVFEMLNLV